MTERIAAPRLPLAVTMGEPAGIGPEIALACWRERDELSLPPFYLVADPGLLAARARRVGIAPVLQEVAPAEAVEAFRTRLPVVSIGKPVIDAPGRPEPSGSAAAIAAIERAVDDVRGGAAAAVVTNPISKAAAYRAGFRHPGHTEFLGALASTWGSGVVRPVMMMVAPELRTVPVTIHIALSSVAPILTTSLIVDTGKIVARDLKRRFGIESPRLAIAGLNPHAGEDGSMGGEEDAIVAPAVQALRDAGIATSGPLPADTMFYPAARAHYDAALCMYHDQALIPVKTIAFADTVNVTLGLPFVRTSPDHGTAFDIAGMGIADARSLAAAIRLAAGMAAHEAALASL